MGGRDEGNVGSAGRLNGFLSVLCETGGERGSGLTLPRNVQDASRTQTSATAGSVGDLEAAEQLVFGGPTPTATTRTMMEMAMEVRRVGGEGWRG